MKISRCFDWGVDEWNQVVESSPSAWLYHRTDWIEIERSFWFPDFRGFMVRSDSGQPLGILPLYVSELGLGHFVERLLHSGIHRHTGLAIVPGLSDKEIESVRKTAMKEVFRIARESTVDRIQLNAQNLAPDNLTLARQEIPFFVEDYHFYFGLAYGPNSMTPAPSKMNCNSDQVVFLDSSEEILFEKIENSAQRAIRKGVKAGVEVFEADSLLDFETIMALRREAATRTAQELLPIEYYKAVAALSATQNHKIMLARVNGNIIGGLEFLLYKSACNYFGGFGLNEDLGVRYYDVLHWQTILWCKNRMIKYYRLGPHFPDMDRDSPVYKKGRFKKKFGGRAFHILQGSFFLTPEKYTS